MLNPCPTLIYDTFSFSCELIINVSCCIFTGYEEEIQKLCWIPFGTKSLEIDFRGGIFYLEPEGHQSHEGINLSVPPGAVKEEEKVTITYGIIMDGPMLLPKEYQFTSPVVYIQSSKSLHLPAAIQIPDWGISPKKEYFESKLSVDSDLPFSKCVSLDGNEGTLWYGGAALYTVASPLENPSKYILSAWKLKRQDGTVQNRLVVTYNHNIWIKVSIISLHKI